MQATLRRTIRIREHSRRWPSPPTRRWIALRVVTREGGETVSYATREYPRGAIVFDADIARSRTFFRRELTKALGDPDKRNRIQTADGYFQIARVV